MNTHIEIRVQTAAEEREFSGVPLGKSADIHGVSLAGEAARSRINASGEPNNEATGRAYMSSRPPSALNYLMPSRRATTPRTSPYGAGNSLLRPAVPNRRPRTLILGVTFTALVLFAVALWTWTLIQPRSTATLECASVAAIDRTTEVIVCVRGIQEQYPQAIPVPGSEA